MLIPLIIATVVGQAGPAGGEFANSKVVVSEIAGAALLQERHSANVEPLVPVSEDALSYMAVETTSVDVWLLRHLAVGGLLEFTYTPGPGSFLMLLAGRVSGRVFLNERVGLIGRVGAGRASAPPDGGNGWLLLAAVALDAQLWSVRSGTRILNVHALLELSGCWATVATTELEFTADYNPADIERRQDFRGGQVTAGIAVGF